MGWDLDGAEPFGVTQNFIGFNGFDGGIGVGTDLDRYLL